MLPHPLNEIGSNSNVKCSEAAAGKDVDAGMFLHWMLRLVCWVLWLWRVTVHGLDFGIPAEMTGFGPLVYNDKRRSAGMGKLKLMAHPPRPLPK